MKITNEHNIGDIVYLITDVDQQERFVCAIVVHPGEVLSYYLACGPDEETDHYYFEISKQKKVM